MTDQALKIVYRDPAKLKPFAKNAREHSEAQVRQIRASMEQYGWTNPVLLRDDGATIGAGHGRALAALLDPPIGKVPTIIVPGLNDAQWRAYTLADNRLPLDATWNMDILKAELSDLQSIGFDLSFTGFDGLELDSLLKGSTGSGRDPEDVPELPTAPVSRRGDVWVCGIHRIGCLDSTDLDAVKAFLGGVTPDFANCDAPYGVRAVKAAGRGGRLKKLGFGQGTIGSPHVAAIGRYHPIIGDETTETAIKGYGVLSALGVPAIVMWGGNYFANNLPPSSCWLVWDKENSADFADGELAWTNQKRAVRIFKHQWNGMMRASERGQKRVHPTQKPVALAEWVHQTVAPKAKTVLDLFLGSGPVLIAAERAGIQCFGMELSPPYVDVAVTRWANLTNAEPTLEATGQTFAEVKAARSKKPRLPRKARPVAVAEAEPVQPAEIL